MGLDAFVFCDCFEKGRLLNPPPAGVSLRVEPDGSLGRESDDGSLAGDLIWDEWRESLACEHSSGMLLRHRLGNISLIGLLRSELKREPTRFPILLQKVVYSGSHGGDYLPVDVVRNLEVELQDLAHFKCSSKESDEFMSSFRLQMLELVAASLSVLKPIAF
jgi:hypothetical protein